MKNRNILGIVSLMLFIIAFLYFDERKKNALLSAQNKGLQNNIKDLQFIIQEINEDVNVPIHTKEKLQELIGQFQNFNEDIAAELHSAFIVMKAGEYSKATATFAKIIEDILKKYFENDVNFQNYLNSKNKRSADFSTLIDFAKQQRIIDIQEHNFLTGLRLERNKEAHELNQNKDKTWLLGNIHIGLEFICRFSSKFNLL